MDKYLQLLDDNPLILQLRNNCMAKKKVVKKPAVKKPVKK
jgi:hypothetical protein